METKRAILFGLLFEEVAPQPQGLLMPTYDEETDLSYVQDREGHRIPYVELGGALGTQTETKAQGETTDTDPGDDRFGSVATSTGTSTKVRGQTMDTNSQHDDARYLALLGTDTVTRIDRETTDTDPGDDQNYYTGWNFLAGTETLTEVDGEPTDKD